MPIRKHFFSISLTLLSIAASPLLYATDTTCPSTGTHVQILGSGGPEVGDGRASSSYLVWHDGKARVLIDVGGGSSDNFGRSGASFEELDAILFSHFHVDHSADLPALIKSSFFDNRKKDLPVYGPSGSHWMPDTEDYLESLFGIEGAFRYLADFMDDGRRNGYRLQPAILDVENKKIQSALSTADINIRAISVRHGPLPALAWRVDIAGKSIVFSGDMNGGFQTLPILAKNADLLIAHNAVPKGARGVERNLHMPPVVIGEIAAQSKVKKVVLSHRMRRTLGHEKETLTEIKKHYSASVEFANDMDCFTP